MTSPWNGGYDQKQLINYVKTDSNGQTRRCNFIKKPDEPMGHFCEGSNTAPEETIGFNTAQATIITANTDTTGGAVCSFSYDARGGLINSFTEDSFSGFFLSRQAGDRSSQSQLSNGCALMICNNG